MTSRRVVLVIGLVSLLGVATAQQAPFRGERFPTPGGAFDVVVADLDADTDLDVIVLSLDAASVRVLIGEPDGGFGAGGAFALPDDDAAAMFADDLDADGSLDLVVSANSGFPSGGWIAVLPGDGLTFGAPVFLVEELVGSTFVRIGDVTGDGVVDVVDARSLGDEVLVHAGNGDGTFAAPVATSVPDGVTDIELLDVDLDGLFDVVLEGDDAIHVYRSSEAGVFVAGQTIPVAAGLLELEVGDVDDDGVGDIVIGTSSQTLRTHLGRGDGSFLFGPTSPIDMFTTKLFLRDVDGDGRLDAVWRNESEAGVHVAIGGGAGDFGTPSRIGADAAFFDVEFVDLDGDGALELLKANHFSEDVGVFAGLGAGAFAVPPTLDVGDRLQAIAAGDVDGDGTLDLAVDDGDEGITILLGDGRGGFAVGASIPFGQEIVDIVLDDLVGDAALDLVVARPSAVEVLRGVGDGTFVASFGTLSSVVEAVATGDVDGNGLRDVAVSRMTPTGAVLRLLIGLGDEDFLTQDVPLPGFPSQFTIGGLDVADLDDDGFDDVVIATPNSGTGDVQVLLGGPDGSSRTPSPVPASAHRVALADLDEDGHVDLLISGKSSAPAEVRAGQGDGTFGPALPLPGKVAERRIDVGDLDRDGHLDVVFANRGGDDLQIHLGRGDLTFDPPVHVTAGDSPRAFVLADLDGDCALDAACASWNGVLIQLDLIDAWRCEGEGLAGGAGTPFLYGSGTLAAGESMGLLLTDASAGAPATLVIGLGLLATPFKGGLLVPSPDLLIAGLAADASGDLALAATWPPGVPPQTDLLFQVWLVDAAGPQGLSASNGLVGTTPGE